MVGEDDEYPRMSELFSGVEGGACEDDDPLQEGATIIPDGGGLDAALDPAAMVRQWANSLTYREVHAFIWGFGPWLLAMATGSAYLLTGALAIVLVSIGWLKLPHRKTPKGLLCESHYALAGAVLGFVLGGTLLAFMRVVTTLGGLVG